jgi:hypothetical protein
MDYGTGPQEGKVAQASLLLLILWNPSKNFCHGYFKKEMPKVEDKLSAP